MRLTIIPSDNVVFVDGKALTVDCSSLDKTIHAVQWDGTSGEVEYATIAGKRKPNAVIKDISAFRSLISAYNAEAAKLPPPPKPATTTKAAKPVNVIAN